MQTPPRSRSKSGSSPNDLKGHTPPLRRKSTSNSNSARKARTARRSKKGSELSSLQQKMSASFSGDTTRFFEADDNPMDPNKQEIDDESMRAREKAQSVLARMEQRPATPATDTTTDDGLGEGMPALMDAKSAGHNSFGSRSSFSKGSLHNSFHAGVAERFLDNVDSDSDDEAFDLSIDSIMGITKYTNSPPNKTPAAALLGRLNGSLHSLRSLGPSLRSLTMGTIESNSHNSADCASEDEDDGEVEFSVEEEELRDQKNIFSNRLNKDLREVDQSVNLMNAQIGKYDWPTRGKRKRNRAGKSMMELFLGDKTKASRLSTVCSGNCGKMCLMMLVMMVVMLLVSPLWSAMTVTSNSSDDTGNDTPSESSKDPATTFFSDETIGQRKQALEELLASSRLAEDVTLTMSHAAQEAMSWLADYDPAQLQLLQVDDADPETDLRPTDENQPYLILQRYALAVLYFATHPDVTSSTVVTTEEEEDENNGRKLQLTLRNWMTEEDVCDWQSITCGSYRDQQDKIVRGIHLSHSQLGGTLPPELGLLHAVTELDFRHNQLGSTIPEWAALTALQSLQVHDNELTGTGDICQELSHLGIFTADCEEKMECDCCTKCY